MTLDKRINSFVLLGRFLKQFITHQKDTELSRLNEDFYTDFEELILRQKSYNGWFDKANVMEAIGAVSNLLTHEVLSQWLSIIR